MSEAAGALRLGLAGAGEHPWPSVERTRRFYLRALGEAFEIEHLPESKDGSEPELDAVLNFSGPRCWHLGEHPPFPLVFAMHGGVVLDQEMLRARLGELESTDVLLVNCTSDVDVLRRMFTGETPRLCHLPLPVDATLFQPLDRDACREFVSIEGCDFVLGFVSRLLPQKGFHYFLRLLAEVKRSAAPRKVAGLVVGNFWGDYPVLAWVSDEYPAIVRELLDELDLGGDVHYFAAQLDDEDLAACFGAMDVLVHPTSSLDENFGYVPVEAMACGVPVVGTAYGGLKDTVVSGETGFLFPSWVTRAGLRMDFPRAVDAVSELLADAGLRSRMSEAARRRALEHYAPRRCGEILCGAVREAVEARRAGEARRLTVAPAPPPVPDAGLLPPLARPWRDFEKVVASYASGPAPRCGEGTRLRLAAPVVADGAGVRLRDPAWPARYVLTASELALAERCRDTVSFAELRAEGLAGRDEVDRLVDLGLLVASGPRNEPPTAPSRASRGDEVPGSGS